MQLTQEYLKSILDYDHKTGLFTWKIQPNGKVKRESSAGYIDKYGYRKIQIKNKSYRSHRLAWFYVYGHWPNVYIDHINGIKTDNRICNLREADRSQNMQNQKKAQLTNKTGLLGVYHVAKSKTFKSIITINKRRIALGNFKTKEDAYNAYIQAKRKLHPFCML